MNSFGFRGYTAVSASTTLTASLHAGRLLRCSGANVTLTLDLAENFTRGDTITILCTASTGQTINVVTSGSDTVAINHGAPGANVPMPIVLRGGDVLILSCYTTNGWSVVLNTSALLSKYQNLADLTNLATARANLDVYSRQEVITEANKLGEVEGLIATQTTATTTSVYMRKAVLVSPTDGSSRVVTRDRSVAMVNDISVVGAGGRDTSTAIGTGWYHLYAIHNDTTGTMSTIVSVNNPYSTTGPVLPAGYTRWVFLTPVRMTSGSIVLFRTQGRYFSYRGWQSVLDAGTSTTLATPPNLFWLWGDAESWILAGRVVANTTGGAVYAYIRNSDQSTDDTIFANSINGTQFWTDAFFEITVRTSASFAYRVGHTGTAGTQVPALYMWCKGFYF